jgi:hypothetical protein
MKKIYPLSWYGLSDTFRFGKYKGKTLLEVFKIAPAYIDWCLREVPTFFMLTETYNKLLEVFPHFKFSEKALCSIKPEKVDTRNTNNLDEYDDDFSITMDWFGYNGPESGFDRYLEENGLDK